METVDTGTVVGLVIMALAVVIFIYRMTYSKTETVAEPVAEKFNMDQPAVVEVKTVEVAPAAITEVVAATAAMEVALNVAEAETSKPAKSKKAKKIVDKTNVLDIKPKTSAAELNGLDKKALLAKAKELNVAVTARMTKEQLVQKLIKA
jgi:hypothetical protein